MDFLKDEQKANFLSVAVSLSPILVNYYIPGFTLCPISDLLLVIASIFAITRRKTVMKANLVGLLFAAYIFVRQLGGEFIFFSSVFHIMLYYVFIAIILCSLDTEEFSIKPIVYVAMVSSLFIIIQTIVYTFGHRYISGLLPFFEHADYLTEFANSANSGNMLITFRPRSFFAEPSHFAVYVAMTLAYTVNRFGKNKKWTIINILLTIGMLVSLSSTGIIFCVIIWGIYFVNADRTTENHHRLVISKRRLSILLLLLVVVIFILQTNLGRSFINAFWDHTINGGLTNRIGYYTTILQEKRSVLKIVIGNGVVHIDNYLPELGYIYWYWGIVGYIFALLIAKHLFKGKFDGKLTYIVLCIGLLFIGGFLTTAQTPFIFYCIQTVKRHSKDAMICHKKT